MITQDLYDEYGFLHPKWKEKLSIINGYLNTLSGSRYVAYIRVKMLTGSKR